jgi:hypothetical protein
MKNIGLRIRPDTKSATVLLVYFQLDLFSYRSQRSHRMQARMMSKATKMNLQARGCTHGLTRQM